MSKSHAPVNRVAVILGLKQPFIEWIVKVKGESSAGLDTKQVFLFPKSEATTDGEKFISEYHEWIFEFLLGSWIAESEYWPEDRSLKVFNDWISCELHPAVIDLAPDQPFHDNK